MNINFFIICLPNTMSKPLNRIKFSPFIFFWVKYLHLAIFTSLIGPPANYKHKRAYKYSSMLISRLWLLPFIIWNLNPTPIILKIFFQKPCVIKSNLIICSTTKNENVASCSTYLAYTSRVVDTSCWLISCCLNFVPRKRGLFNV